MLVWYEGRITMIKGIYLGNWEDSNCIQRDTLWGVFFLHKLSTIMSLILNKMNLKCLEKFREIQNLRCQKIFQNFHLDLREKVSVDQNNLEKEEESWRYQVPWLQTTLQGYNSQNSIGTKNWHIERQNRLKRPEVSPHTYGQLIYNNGGKHIQQGKDSLFSRDAGETGWLHVKEWN